MSNKFQLKAPFKPAGDQPAAIKKLVTGLKSGLTHQTLLGTTGSGKTMTMASVVAKTQMPALIISHNKTLAAQLYQEFKEFFPANAVNYFVSYYDYYQPEAYLAPTDTYIAKDASINEEIDRLRHATMAGILTRPDCIVVASVSCIYGLSQPADYLEQQLLITQKQHLPRPDLLRRLTNLHYTRNNYDLTSGTYRVRGDIVDIHLASEDNILRLEYFGPNIDRLLHLDNITGEVLKELPQASVFPATLFITNKEREQQALASIRKELAQQTKHLSKRNKRLEAKRLQQRTAYDLEMIENIGYVSGIENYSRHFDGRSPGEPPATLIDYFHHSFGGRGFLTFIDESHMTIPQIAGMHAGDQARKNNLIEFGFRLPSARDNRPLKFHEFENKISSAVFVSATPAQYERDTSQQIIEQIVRPTGLLDPTIAIKPIKHQFDDIVEEITSRVRPAGKTPGVDRKTPGVEEAGASRVLVTTLTKRLSEDLATYLIEIGIKAAYLHSDISTLDRLDILRDLRRGTYDVLVGINLLREGLDLPEVSLVIIMDADKEGFLRSTTSLVQLMGRAARHRQGHVIMYADRITGSMRQAIKETTRRRHVQEKHNQKHHITPRSIKKDVRELIAIGSRAQKESSGIPPNLKDIPPDEVKRVIHNLTDKMNLAANNLDFEHAAKLRDAIKKIKQLQPRARKKML